VSKNVAVFVDVANIFYAAKAAGVDIDYVTLLKASSAGRDLVRAYAYTGLDPENENQRNFHDFLRRHGYKVVSKDIRKYGDGKVKANLDIELVVDMMKTARNLDIAIVVSGDGDFAPAIRAVQEQGVRVEVVSFRGNTSSDLMDVADIFTDITQIAKVEKGSSRSGRRVSEDEADLSMTEVPEKQSEGTGERTRGRGRTRRTSGETTSSRARGRAIAPAAAASDAAEAPLVVLPGEKLSRAAATTAAEAPADADLDEAADAGGAAVEGDRNGDEGASEDARRRRRRRGGRGRGRGRGRDEGSYVDEDARVGAAAPGDDEHVDAEPSPARRAASAFGSVWDSQIGIPASSSASVMPAADDEDLEEPAVPEYLLTERRQRDAGRGRGGGGRGRGRGGAYAAALERERFGGGRGSTPSRFQEPPRSRESGYGRDDRRDDRRDRDRGDRQQFRQAPRPAARGGDEPWSEVPPEIEAMLRAQLGSRPAPAGRGPAPAEVVTDQAAATESAAPEAVPAVTRRSTRRSPSKAAAGASDAAEGAAAEAAPSPARRATTRKPRATAVPAETAAESGGEVPATDAGAPTTRRRTTSRSRTAAASTPTDEAATADAPKRRTTRRKAEPAA
jgi:uncharacterized LabA/DUF88 family protein